MQRSAISEYSSKSLMLYFLILALVSATFATHILPVHWMVSGAVQYLFFFIALKQVCKECIRYCIDNKGGVCCGYVCPLYILDRRTF